MGKLLYEGGVISSSSSGLSRYSLMSSRRLAPSAVFRRSPSAPSKLSARATLSAISVIRCPLQKGRILSWRWTSTCRFLLADNNSKTIHTSNSLHFARVFQQRCIELKFYGQRKGCIFINKKTMKIMFCWLYSTLLKIHYPRVVGFSIAGHIWLIIVLANKHM